ncbi:MAG: hypothetical protein ACRC0L_04185 [Angustibacter sp.]
MNRRNTRRIGLVLGGTALVLSACGQAPAKPGAQSGSSRTGAASAAGLVCGVIDQSHVSDIFELPAAEQNAKTELSAYPQNSAEFTDVSCTISSTTQPREVLSLEITRGPFNEKPRWNFLKELQDDTASVPEALSLPSMLGEGRVAPGVGGYIIRECPKGGQYLLAVTTRTQSGTATKWLRLLSAAVPLADDLGACPTRG